MKFYIQGYNFYQQVHLSRGTISDFFKIWVYASTVKPVYNGHPWDPEKVIVIQKVAVVQRLVQHTRSSCSMFIRAGNSGRLLLTGGRQHRFDCTKRLKNPALDQQFSMFFFSIPPLDRPRRSCYKHIMDVIQEFCAGRNFCRQGKKNILKFFPQLSRNQCKKMWFTVISQTYRRNYGKVLCL